MKTNKILSALLIMALMIAGNSKIWAQPGPKGNYQKNQGQNACQYLPDLNQEQENQIETLRTQHLKITLSMQNELDEKYARYKTLMTANNPDMDAINKLIDEIVSIKGKLMKERASHQQSVRKVLTEDQRVIYDQHLSIRNYDGFGKGNSHKGKGNRNNWE